MHQPFRLLDRRHFLKQGAVLAAGAFVPAWMHKVAPAYPGSAAPVRIRGRVAAAGRGLARVAVTDGWSIVETDGDGTFELIASTRQPFVYLSLPAGYAVPQNETGTARFYRPILPDAGGEMTATFDLASLEMPDENHAFLVLADPQTQDTYETGLLHEQTVPDVQATLKALGEGPVFGVACGDIMFDHLDLYPEYERAVARMEIPFFQVVGNHDLDFDGMTDEASVQTFSRHFGPAYYSFDRGAVHYVVLDDVFWNHDHYLGYLDAAQLAWLEADLARIERGRPVVVFMHIPAHSTRSLRQGANKPSPTISVTNRDALYQLLEPFAAHIISGHTHENEHVFEGGVHEHVLGATCGAWWSGPICDDGTPSGYGVFEVRGEDIRWQYKATGFPAEYQLRVYERGADPKAPDEFVANVWGWDPEWSVVWYEDGLRKGAMARRPGTDPLSERLHRGSALPERRPWVDPAPTEHLFYAPVAPEAQEVRVEVVDRWGQRFSATPVAPTHSG